MVSHDTMKPVERRVTLASHPQISMRGEVSQDLRHVGKAFPVDVERLCSGLLTVFAPRVHEQRADRPAPAKATLRLSAGVD